MGCCVAVPQDRVYIIENIGKFSRLAGPGFACVGIPCIRKVSGKVSLRLNQIVVPVETKTKDNVFVNFQVAVQYKVKREKVYEAFYTLADPLKQIQSYIFDVVRATVPRLNLDEVFESKDRIARDVLEELVSEMEQYGFQIRDALVVDVSPDAKVRDSMNEINASKRNRNAAHEKAEAEKVRVVKNAEAESESKYLQGLGLARQRKAIIDGLKNNVLSFSNDVQMDSKAVTDLVMVTQYFDTLKDLSQGQNTQCVYYQDDLDPTASAAASDLRSAMIQGNLNLR